MITLVFCLILSVVFGLICFASSKQKQSYHVSLVMFFLAVSSLLIGVACYPVTERWWSEFQKDIAINQAQVEVNRAKSMIGVLGSPDLYVEYLKTQTK